MKKALIVVLLLSATNAFAYLENPYEPFRMKDFKTTVTIRAVKDIQKSCDAESKRRGMGGFGYAVEACSFWDNGIVNNSCTIFLSEKPNFHTLGHEMRHCIQGNFHK